MAEERQVNGRSRILFDMEWNQPLPWKQYPKVPKALMPGEVIQIGAVRLDAAGRVESEFSVSVRPRHFRQAHWKVKKLTHLSDEEILGGLPFPEAAAQFGAWCGERGTFNLFSWGGEDERVLCANLEAWGLDPDWLPPLVYDLRLIYDGLRKQTTSTSLLDAAAELGVTLELEQHDSLNDARYAAAICAAIDVEQGIAHYEELGPGPALPPGEQRLALIGFPNPLVPKGSPLEQCRCPVCGEALCCRIWIPQNKDRQIGLAPCPMGHSVFLRTRFSRRPDGRYSALRLIYPATAEAADFYEKKHRRFLDARRRTKQGKKPETGSAVSGSSGQAQG